MRKIICFFLLSFFSVAIAPAQTPGTADSSLLLLLNQQTDNEVVKQNIPGLEKLYADDFVFSHGSGRVEGKQNWFKSVAKGNFLSRQHDSVTVELHPDTAIVKGKLTVQKKNATSTDRYWLRYIRVYAYRNRQWLMVSHSTTYEYHEPAQ